MNIGYIRVSSEAQNTERQLANIKLDKIFKEKVSAKSKNRKALKECIDFCREEDHLYIHSIDRLARNLKDLQDIVDTLNNKSVSVSFIKENLSFSSGEPDLMSKLMFQMLGAFAEFERSIIRERQAEGIAIARAKNKYKGRNPGLNNEESEALFKKRNQYKTPISVLAREYGVSRTCIYNAVNRGENIVKAKQETAKDKRNLEIELT